jgi:Amino acid permease
MPSVAEYGWSSIAYYLLGALFFFVPLSLVVAELGTGWPRAGGLYAWVKEGFGDRSGFLAIWFEWVENIRLSSPFGGDSSVRKGDLDAGAAEVDHRDQGVGGLESVRAV